MAAEAGPLAPRLNAYIPVRPTPRQAAFLLLPHLEAFFGGAAGGGKSAALLMAALAYVDLPAYHAVLVRESFAALAEAGALAERARRWLGETDATWNGAEHLWRFPSGASLSFRPLREEGDERAFMGAEYQFIGIDEVTNVTEAQYRFLLSRLRRPATSTLPLRMRATGMPYGPGVDWVRWRFVDGGRAEGRIFIPSRLEDNPHLDRETYERALEGLDPLSRRRSASGTGRLAPRGACSGPPGSRSVSFRPKSCRRAWRCVATGTWPPARRRPAPTPTTRPGCCSGARGRGPAM